MASSNTIVIEGVGQVLFERSRRARRLNISVRPFTGVRVAVPHGLSFKRAEEFVRAKSDWIRKHLHRMKQHRKEDRILLDTGIGIGKEEAKRILTRRLRHLAEKHGFTYNRVFIRNQRTRWGSCSHKNNISLNMNIVGLPDALIDYIILHELTHIRFKHHGNAFWVELDRFVGNGKAMASRLNEYRVETL